MKVKLLLILSFFAFFAAEAQVNYSFASSTGTYSAILGTSPAFTATSFDGGSGADEAYSASIPIGFSFLYNGSGAANTYTTIKMTSNGFLYLGAGTPTTSMYGMTLPTGETAIRPAIGPFIADLDLVSASNMTYTTTGSAGSRIFTAQWTGAKWNYSASAGSISFQVKLYETTNKIEFIYQQEAGTTSATPTAQIGLTNATTSYLSVNAAGTAASSSTATSITARPASGTIYTFTPVVQPANDIAVNSVYALSKTVAGNPDSVKVYVSNLGTAAGTNTQIFLSVTGANTYKDTVTVASFASAAAGFVTFVFTPNTPGTNVISASVANDENNANNTVSYSQSITVQSASTANAATTTLGVGSNTAPLEFGTRFANTGTKTIDQLTLYWPSTSTGQPYIVNIYDASGTGGLPGTTPIFTSATQTTNGANANINVTPAVSITGSFYVTITQTTATNVGYGYESETPLRPNTFFLRTTLVTGAWSALGGAFKLMMDVRFSSGLLPATFGSFVGTKNGEKNVLNWNTLTEVNNTGFSIERSSDGKNFGSIATVASKAVNGNSQVSTSYEYSDNKPFAGTNYYRLKQADKDGKVSYSQIVALKSAKLGNITIAAIYPNPAKDKLNITIVSGNTEKATLAIYDATGRLVLQKSLTLIAGEVSLSENIDKLKAGSYLVKVIDEKGVAMDIKTLIKQ